MWEGMAVLSGGPKDGEVYDIRVPGDEPPRSIPTIETDHPEGLPVDSAPVDAIAYRRFVYWREGRTEVNGLPAWRYVLVPR